MSGVKPDLQARRRPPSGTRRCERSEPLTAIFLLRPLLATVLAAAFALASFAVRAADAPVVALPPFFVEGTAQDLPWRYADVAGFEVLSTCSERLTRDLVANHHRLHAVLGELLPPALQFKTSVKRSLIFLDAAHQPPTSQEVVAELVRLSADKTRLEDTAVPLDDGRLRRAPPPRYTFVPNLRLWDRDVQALFAIVSEREFDANRVALTPDYVAYLLRNRLPALPPWFISGVLTLYTQARFAEDALTLERLEWIPETGGAALLKGTSANRPLLPLAEFFAGELAAADSAEGEGLSLWRAQAALFVRWGLAGRGAPRRAALWQFAERAAVEPVTEKLFQECFGSAYATAQQQLAAFLPEAMRERLTLRPASRPRLPDYAVRPASEVEVARIKGDWERLEIGYVKAQFPGLAPKYLEQARRTLKRAYDGGSRDPQLLAVLGLCEADAGNETGAREFLEAVAAAKTSLRPRAGFELARLRFAALRARSAGPDARLTFAQAGEVFAPLLAAREQSPPLAEVYELLAEVWAACADKPTRDQLAVIEEGVRLFPRRTELVYRVAELNVRHGFAENARWLINLGLAFAPDAPARARFEQLQARIGTTK